MSKSIISVGFEIPGHDDKYFSIDSDQSLLDYDIIVFRPKISGAFSYTYEQFRGKPCLNDNDSFSLKEKSERWRQELRSAFDHGKTIIIFLPAYDEVYAATGDHRYSGSGRSRVTTRIVDSFFNYGLIPLYFDELTSAHGKEIKPTKDLGLLASYWKDFGPLSEYQIYFDSASLLPSASSLPLLTTKAGNKTVGCLVRDEHSSGKGTFVLLPELEYDLEQFQVEKAGDLVWNKRGLEFGSKIISAFVEIDKALHSEKQQTPMPDWAKSAEYRILNESVLEKKIGKLTSQIESLHDQKRTLLDELDKEGSLRHLLYETGPSLEDAILDALGVLGLKAERYKDAQSEFDAFLLGPAIDFWVKRKGKIQKQLMLIKSANLSEILMKTLSVMK
jgi:hypothetical protein